MKTKLISVLFATMMCSLLTAATRIDSNDFSIGFGYEYDNSSSSWLGWTTAETNSVNTPITIGDFTFSPSAYSLCGSGGGTYFPDRVLTDNGIAGGVGYSYADGRDGSFEAILNAKYSGNAPHEGRLIVDINSISIYAAPWSTNVHKVWFRETTPGNESNSPDVNTIPYPGSTTDPNGYVKLTWNPEDFWVNNRSVTRTFGLGSSMDMVLDGFEISGTISYEYFERRDSGDFGRTWVPNYYWEANSVPVPVWGNLSDWTYNGNGTVTIIEDGVGGLAGWSGVANYQVGWTVEGRFRVDAAKTSGWGVYQFSMADGNDFYGLVIDSYQLVDIYDSSNTYDNINLTDGFHTVRISQDGNHGTQRIYLDDKLIDFNIGSFPYSDDNLMAHGDGTDAITSGTITLDYLRLDTTGAYAPLAWEADNLPTAAWGNLNDDWTVNGNGTVTVVQDADDEGAGWSDVADANVGWTAEIRLRVDAVKTGGVGVYMLYLADGRDLYNLVIDSHCLVDLFDSENVYNYIDLTDDFHTIRIAQDGNSGQQEIYLDGKHISYTITSIPYSAANWMAHGDGTGAITSGGVTVDYFRVDNTGAYSPDVNVETKPIIPDVNDFSDAIGIHAPAFFGPTEMYKPTGAMFWRLNALWDWYETTKGVYDFNGLDLLIYPAIEFWGQKPVVVIGGHNALYDGYDPNNVPAGLVQLDPDQQAGFYKFAAALAYHYRGEPIIFELGNEPTGNGTGIYHIPLNRPYGYEYAAWAIDAAAAMRAVDPDVIIAGPAAHVWGYDFMKEAIAANLLDAVDIITVHGYQDLGGLPPVPPQPAPEGILVHSVTGVPALKAYAGIPADFPMAISEWGYKRYLDPNEYPAVDNVTAVTEEQQRNYVPRAIMLTALQGLRFNIWFAYNMPSSHFEAGFGLLCDSVATPAYDVIVNMAYQLPDANLVQRIDVGEPNDYVLEFDTSDGTVWVVWTADSNHSISFSVANDVIIRAYDIVGDTYIDIEANDNMITIDVNEAVQYLTIPAPEQASSPIPADEATDESIVSVLSWTAGSAANSHDVYFGTNLADVNNATHTSDEYKSNQTGTSYNPGNLSATSAYYWRVDEINGGKITKGDVWSFTTASPTTIFIDGFESNFDKWTDGGTTDWDRTTSYKYSGSYSAHAGSADNDLFSDNINTSGYYSMTITFWYRDDDIDDDDNIYLQLYDGSAYDNKFEMGNNSPEDTWYKYEVTIYNTGSDAQYFRSNFCLKFEGTSIDYGENLWIDDVSVVVQY